MAHELQSFNRNLLLLYRFLNTLLVALEEVGAWVPGAVPLEELLSKPAIEALVVLALHVGASLPYAVHGVGIRGGGGALQPQGFNLLPVASKVVPSVIASSVCWSLQCVFLP